MTNLEAHILSHQEVTKIRNRHPKNPTDFLGRLQMEEHFGRPVVKIIPIAPTAPNSHIIVLCADGYMRDKKPVIKGDYEYVSQCITLLCHDTYNSPRKITELYGVDMKRIEELKLAEWLGPK